MAVEKLVVDADFELTFFELRKKSAPPLRSKGGNIQRKRHLLIAQLAQSGDIFHHIARRACDIAVAPRQLLVRLFAATTIGAIEDTATPHRQPVTKLLRVFQVDLALPIVLHGGVTAAVQQPIGRDKVERIEIAGFGKVGACILFAFPIHTIEQIGNLFERSGGIATAKGSQ